MMRLLPYSENHLFCLYLISLISVIAVKIQLTNGVHEITVCTYNIWNIMFSWEVRMRHIANMVSQAGCEVLVLQEVRLHSDRSGSQADRLQRLLPQFPWVVTRRADHVSKPTGSLWPGWEEEGLAVLSQLPIGNVKTEHLSRSHGPDTNQRIALHVPILTGPKTTVNVIGVHFSYDRQQQCQNAVEILTFIHKNKLNNAVIAGDFNTYTDFGDPLQLFIKPDAGSETRGDWNKCRKSAGSLLPATLWSFQDVWEASHRDSPGFTFSNMPEPGLTSRPDRILASSSLRVMQTSLQGDGGAYKVKHSSDLFFHRLHTVVRAAKQAYSGGQGYPCLQDCGPHGTCRCGVCVRKEQGDNCDLQGCEECSAGVFSHLCVFLTIIILLLILAGTAAVKFLVVAARIDQSGGFLMPGFTCCLCNPLLVRQPTFSSRTQLGRFLRILIIGRLPPAILLVLSVITMALCSAVAAVWFRATLDTAASVMAEEYFPSDHLMVVTRLEVS